MKGWRRSKRHDAAKQPNLPGLLAPPVRKSRRLATPHDLALEVARRRLTGGLILFALAYLLIGGRLVFVTLLNDAPEIPTAQPTMGDSVASRADVLDRNGTVLATSLPTVSLCADGRKIQNPDEAAKQLLGVLPELDAKRVSEDLHSAKHCVMIKRHLTPSQSYQVNKLGIAGFEFRPDERRIYPAGDVAAHVVGYTDIDDNGIAGMEKELDKRLEEEPDPVSLSVDLRLQAIMRRELAASMSNFNAVGATGLIMDISTGEILALVSLPDFDPQHPGDANDDERFNRATLGVYEMGSTFKIFNTALALDSGLIHLGDAFDTVHPLEVGGQFIRDFHSEKRWLNVAEIFTHSSNIGSARMADRIGGARQRAFLARLGLTEKSSIELPEVGAPLVPSARDWSEATTMTAAFGHGIAVNSIQLAAAVGTIVNNGIPVHPTLLKRPATYIEDADDAQDRVISPRTSAILRGLMRLVVTKGTAKGNDVAGYMLGGKTGTADKLGANHRYLTNARMSSFMGVFPVNKPRYMVFAMLDDPKGNAKTYGFATGGWVAAPAVSRIVAQIGPLLDMTPLPPEAEAAAERQTMKPLGAAIVDGIPVEEGSNYASVESDSVQ
jgi:cell division protein FtsI (penicillin-binding protein 3)